MTLLKRAQAKANEAIAKGKEKVRASPVPPRLTCLAGVLRPDFEATPHVHRPLPVRVRRRIARQEARHLAAHPHRVDQIPHHAATFYADNVLKAPPVHTGTHLNVDTSPMAIVKMATAALISIPGKPTQHQPPAHQSALHPISAPHRGNHIPKDAQNLSRAPGVNPALKQPFALRPTTVTLHTCSQYRSLSPVTRPATVRHFTHQL